MLLAKHWVCEQDKDELLLPAWQRLVDLMAELCGTPAGFIVQAGSDKYRVIIANESVDNPYKANATIDSDVNFFCREVVKQDSCLYVGNASEQERWLTNPEVSEDGFNTYMGYPLHWPDGSVFGTICIMDFVKTEYSNRYHKLMMHFRDMAERELDLLNKNIQLQNFALSDDLTSLFNRKGFFVAAEQLVKSAKRDKADICICYFDLDDLKPINDNYGHQVGDDVIKQFARYLKEAFREVDVIARFGGDEFVVMCQESQPLDINKIVQRLNESIAKAKQQPQLSFSYGYASIKAGEVNSEAVEYLIKLADDNMYKDKIAKKQLNR